MKNKKETTLLDSSLNTVDFCDRKHYKNYNIKVLDCKDFKQIYIFDRYKIKTTNNIENKLKINQKKETTKTEDNNIEFKNINRAKLNLQRLVKCNIDCWRSFVTLTFKNKVTDLNEAYKEFRKFIINTQIRKKDLKYICVPEYQKNGKVHYHLVTNIELDDPQLCYTQTYKGKEYIHLKLWSKKIDKNNKPKGRGFDLVETIEDKDGNDTKKICGYISKYISKSYVSNSFFNKNRYYCSQNLERPQEILLDMNNQEDYNYFMSLANSNSLIYSNTYQDDYENNIIFYEYLKETNA